MTTKIITPRPSIIMALGNLDFPGGMPGAISELVDNSLGSGRGDSGQVHVTYNKGRLTVLDNGRGMDDVLDLFEYGAGAGLLEGDIGKYGFGGTSALPWLADFKKDVAIYSLRDGKVTNTKVCFDKLSQQKTWEASSIGPRPVTSTNCPDELRELGHGTLIVLECKRNFYKDNVVAALRDTYAPALRNGKIITVKYNTTKLETLRAPRLAHGMPLSISFAHQGREFTAEGVVVSDANIPLSKSNVAIGFGHRVIFRTTDCYSHGDLSYSGQGVAVALTLTGSWQDVLTSTKNEIADDAVRAKLMSALFGELEATLVYAEAQSEHLMLADLGANLGAMLGGSAWVTGKRRGTTGVIPGTGGGGGGGGTGGAGDSEPADPTTSEEDSDAPKVKGGAAIKFMKWNDKDLDEGIWQFRCEPERPQSHEDILVNIGLNMDVPGIKRAIMTETGRNSTLALILVPALVRHLCAVIPDELLANVFNKRVWERACRLEESGAWLGQEANAAKVAYISRHLLARVK
jgi:hypothetical protein